MGGHKIPFLRQWDWTITLLGCLRVHPRIEGCRCGRGSSLPDKDIELQYMTGVHVDELMPQPDIYRVLWKAWLHLAIKPTLFTKRRMGIFVFNSEAFPYNVVLILVYTQRLSREGREREKEREIFKIFQSRTSGLIISHFVGQRECPDTISHASSRSLAWIAFFAFVFFVLGSALN